VIFGADDATNTRRGNFLTARDPKNGPRVQLPAPDDTPVVERHALHDRGVVCALRPSIEIEPPVQPRVCLQHEMRIGRRCSQPGSGDRAIHDEGDEKEGGRIAHVRCLF
jgi:hypothetical protein